MYNYQGKPLMRIMTHQGRDAIPPLLIFDGGRTWDVVFNLRNNLVASYKKLENPSVEMVVRILQEEQKEAGQPLLEVW
jgi:hypothetical protein